MSPHTGELPRAPSRPGLTSHPARCASCASAWGSARAMAVDIIPQHGKTDRRPANPAIPPRLCGRPVTRGSPRPPGPLLPRAPHPRSGEPRAPVHPSSVPASTASTLRGLGTPPDSPPDSSFLDCDQTPLGTPCFRSSRCPHAGVPPRGRAPSLGARAQGAFVGCGSHGACRLPQSFPSSLRSGPAGVEGELVLGREQGPAEISSFTPGWPRAQPGRLVSRAPSGADDTESHLWPSIPPVQGPGGPCLHPRPAPREPLREPLPAHVLETKHVPDGNHLPEGHIRSVPSVK